VAEGGGEEQAIGARSGTQAVFISYASQDAQAAARICDALRAAGIEVWFDRSELRGGDAWDREIHDRIHNCRILIAIISANTEARDEGYFRREWKLAVDRTHDMADGKAFLVPVAIDDTPERGASVPDKFRQIQWTRLPGGEIPRAFVDRIAMLVGAGGPRSSLRVGAEGVPSTMGQSPTTRRKLRPWLALPALAIAVAGGWFAWRHAGTREPIEHPASDASGAVAADKSIAVLPFTDMSEKKDQEYFADGLAEEVLSLLATLPDLKVISRTSSFQFKGRNADLRAIGAQLGAAYVVEGSVRRSGDRVRVTAQLISSRDGLHRWSESYEQNFGDVLRMQQDIAAALGRALQVEVGNASWGAAVTLTNTEAYSLYLHGLHSMDRNDKPGLDEAISYFERALAVDPTLYRAREKLAHAHYVELELGLVSPATGAARLRADLDLLLKDDPHSAIGHALRAELLITYDWDWVGAKREADMAVSLAKNCSLALYAAADLASVLGRWDESETLFQQALALDPLDADTHNEFSWMLYHAGRYAEAEVEGRRLLEIRPSYATAHLDLGLYLLAEGKLQEALSVMQQESLQGPRSVGLAMVFHALHRNGESDAALQVAEQVAAEEWAYEIGCAHAFRGERDAAFQWLDRAYAQKDFLMEYVKSEWALKGLESDARYKALMRKMNLQQ
jgi:TolB-like protein